MDAGVVSSRDFIANGANVKNDANGIFYIDMCILGECPIFFAMEMMHR